jgi:hypothetical protein
LWINSLGVRNKPDPLMDWDQLYNLKNQAELRKDCRELIDKCSECSVTVPQLESLITLYCKKRKMEYEKNNGWLEIIGKLIQLPFDFDQSALWNVFYAVTTKFVPRLEKSSRVFDLFRLILQYHDPELCSCLDSLKVLPQQYAHDWFSTLLSKDTDTELCWTIWDQYFEKGDPFLIFFVSLAFVMSAREEVMNAKDAKEIVYVLTNAPRKMAMEDVFDLLDVCYVHLSLTPISIREDFHCMLFGSNLVEEYSDFPLDFHQIMCLPVSVQELYKRVLEINPAATSAFTYFVIDARSKKEFCAGSIPGSYNLNGKLIVDEPASFNIAMSSLLKFKEDSCPKDHICFVGSGLEEDDSYMMMVISKFLQQKQEHISYVDGGYKALHSLLADISALTKLSNHFSPSDCKECSTVKKTSVSSGWSVMERMKSAVKSKSEAVKSKVQGFVESPSREELVKHVNSTDRFGKRYRNVQSVFSINEDDSHESEDDLSICDQSTPSVAEKLKWDEVVRKPEIIDHFEGHEIFQDKTYVKCYIALSRTHMHIFHDAKEHGFVRTSVRHQLSSVMRVTSKKRVPEFLTFKFGYELPTGEAHINRVHCFLLPPAKAGDCAKAVKTAIIALKPIVDDE